MPLLQALVRVAAVGGAAGGWEGMGVGDVGGMGDAGGTP